MKKLVSYCGVEFVNNDFNSLGELKRFVHVFSPPETPQHNGYAKCANRTILEKTRCLINSSGLPKCYWAEAPNTAVLLSNLGPTPSTFNLSPYTLWTGNSPRLMKLRVHTKRQSGLEAWPSWRIGVLLGYENDILSYWVLRLINKKVLISKHERLNELVFPFTQSSSSVEKLEIVGENKMLDLGEVDEVLPQSPVEAIDEICPTEVNESEEADEDCALTAGPVPRDDSRGVDEFPLSLEQVNAAGGSSNGDQDNILTYPRRPKTLVTKAADVPKTFRSALKGPFSCQWSKAIEKELSAMVDLKVWDVVDLTPDYRLVGTTWVFRLKTNHLKEVTEYKAWLCAQGFSQTPGVDFGKTYSPMGRLNSLRCLISYAVSKGLAFHQVDVKSAFLNRPLSKVIYLSIPQGLDLDRRKSCLRLKKAIYGLKQALLAWYNSLNHFWQRGLILQDQAEIEEHFIEALLELYGMDSCRSMSTPLFPNTHLVPASDDEVEKFNGLGVNFQSAIGSINYLTPSTRPDISHAVSSLSQFLEKPGYLHWQAFLHMLRYLKGTADVGLVYRKSFPVGVKAWSDADWVCDLASESIWLKQWGQECGLFKEMSSIPIHEDNQGCIRTINGDCSVNNKQMKHVDIQLHFIKETMQNGVFKIFYTPTSHMLADFLTKSSRSEGDVGNQDKSQFYRQSATPTLSERHNSQSYCRSVNLCQLLLHLLTFLFCIQTPVLYITVVAVPIILVISCPPFSLAFLQFLLVECQEVIPVCKLCKRPTTPIKDPIQFTCWQNIPRANCNDLIDACQRKYPSKYGQCMWEDCQSQTPVKKSCEGNHSTGQLCSNCRSKQWQLGSSGKGYGGISSQLEIMQLGD
ncbi:hypothetical protein O181_024616 [Austropuccinia psidii MF-1]|uniref:Integrase catalytic domain-containing protein n=1 Tax=Austropuccinia psidii MF-1 TaxID=1389203 RepID=A0A9Q3GYS6_9BASI|nr:hypothetical protein [Austropuccinia psidii MF-1]